MPIQRSSDLLVVRNLKSQVQTTQAQVQDLQQSAASDFKHQHYYDMNSALADQNIKVENLLRQHELNIKNFDWAQNVLYMQEGALKRLNDIVENAKELSVIAMNQIGNRAVPAMALDSKALLSRVEDELKTSYFGMNVWNGSRINELPFSDIVNSDIDANFYSGDDFDLKFYISSGPVQFGDRANYDCFKNLITAVKMMRDSQDSTTRQIDKDQIQQASELLDRATLGFLDLLQKAGNAQKSMLQAKKTSEDNMVNLSEMYTKTLNGMSEEDRALTVVDIAAIQRKLSYILPTTMKYLNDMSVVKYL